MSGSASIAFEWFPYQGLVGYHLVIGYTGTAFFGLATLKFVRTMFAAKGPVVFISRYGIRDLRVANEFILGDNHIDPEKWSPLIYNFRHYFRLADKELGKTFRAER